MMNTPDDFTGPVNAGNPVEFTIRQLAETVIDITGSRSELVSTRCPDISLARQMLGWAGNEKIRREEGLVNTINYFDDFLKKFS